MNNQQISKILTYYRLNHNYHPPYTFLLDGNFLKILLEKDINFDQKIKPLITGKYKIKVTGCLISQLEILGREFSIVLEKAKQYPMLKCKHKFCDAIQCIAQHVKNQESIILCTQDIVLRRKMRGRNVAMMYFGPDQRITMEDIERHQAKDMKELQKQKLMPQAHEKQELEIYKEQQAVLEKLKKKNQEEKAASARGVQLKFLKKKFVKGPNPLSVKKKHNRDQNNSNPIANETNGQALQKKKRIRKKNKNKKNQNTEINE